MTIAIALVGAYVVGSIDFAVIIARMHGVDIHEIGSGNPGTSNVLRTLGRLPAAMVLIGDTMKGVIGASMGAIAGGLVSATPSNGISQWAFAAGFAAVVGHCYPIFHKFKGGKGVATGFGVVIFTVWQVALVALLVWVVLARFTKVASISSLIVIVLAIPLAIWQGVTGLSLMWMVLTVVLIVWRHRANIGRMLKGIEERVPT
ncbi:MAG: glycerol-3-phosphate 1-O-acyltransferase PlsY [Acidobacteria bacterium]|nr:glycerol-3-phosphate 1-O-acyltransferase PlsY [Acidobacteriota bacterium]MCZ6505083.1 glycerol-3-phosphate 1-O-acyltransferase PlsY [Actinomycetota bacterium]MCZ6740000.1 glycerol-3-phosphate 1-O-acyltransferase PlsY [Actinomycetota bacterium]